MSEFDNFIANLSDHELSIFIGYQYNAFLENSREKINKEIIKRNLSAQNLEHLFKKKINTESKDKSKNCPRCGSNKLFLEIDYEEKAKIHYVRAEVAIETNRCRLCGFNPDKETPKNIFERVKRIFKNNKTERFIKWK